MEIGKRPDSIQSGDANSIGKALGAKKSSETPPSQLPAFPGKSKALKDLLAEAKNALHEPLPDIPHRILQNFLKEKHLYISPSDETVNFDLAAAALLGQKAPQAFIDRIAKHLSQKPNRTSLEPKHEERMHLQAAEKAENTIQKIRSGKILSQQK